MEVNHRFSISSYRNEEKATKNTLGINSPKFSQLVFNSQALLQDRLNSKDLQEVFKNKSVAMLFLDKISNLIGKHHPDSLEARKFMGGPCSYPSIELIRHLSNLLSNPNLSRNSIQNLEKWIASEQACLPISLIFDAWGLADEESVIRSTTKGDYTNAIPQKVKVEPPPNEVESFIFALANEMKGMSPGGKFKMPAGAVGHVTRLEFIKNEDGTFDIIHFNTGLGARKIDGQTTTAYKYISIPAKKLEDPLFWKQLVEAKMQPGMNRLKELLSRTASYQRPLNVNSLLKKRLQQSGSCSFHAAEAEFKHSFISSFPSIEEGWKAYKQCTSLMASEAVKLESSGLEPKIENMLAVKANVRRRYQDWMTILNNPEKLDAAKNAYIDAIASLGVHSKEANRELIGKLPPLMALSLLDKRLNEGLNLVSFGQLNLIRNTYGPAVTFDGFNHIGYKQLKWLESTREVFRDVVEFAGWKGDLFLKVQEISSFLLPTKWNDEVQTKISYAKLSEESLPPLLTDYLLREDPAVGNQLFQTLKKDNIIPENFSFDQTVLLRHMEACFSSDPQKALALASKVTDVAIKADVLKTTYEALVNYGHIKEALQLINQFFEGIEKHARLCEVAIILLERDDVEGALKVAKASDYPIAETISSIITELSESRMFDEAIGFINIVPEEHSHLAICQLIFELVKRDHEKEAMLIANRMPYSSLGSAINFTVERLCEENLINDAIIFILSIPKEFYQHKSHMIIEEAFKFIVIHQIRNGERSNARLLALKIPSEPLRESILRVAKYYKD